MEENNEYERTIELKELWHIFVQRWWILLLCGALCLAGAWAYKKLTWRPMYKSTATLYILNRGGESITSTDLSIGLNVVSDCIYSLQSHAVLDKVLDLKIAPAGTTYEDLAKQLTINNEEKTRFLEVTVTASSPEVAKQLVDSICTFGTAKINETFRYEQISIHETGTLSDKPCNSTSLSFYLIAAMVGALLAYLVLLCAYILDDSIHTDEDVHRYLGLTVLATIPNMDETHEKKFYGYRNGTPAPSADTADHT